MAAIKRFFEKRKLNAKFKLAGEGHRLDAAGSSTPVSPRHEPTPVVRSPETLEKQRLVAEAALARMNQQQRAGRGSAASRGGPSLRAQIRQEMEAEKAAAEKATVARYTAPREVNLEAAAVVGHVLYRCPLVGEDVVLPKDEMEAYIEAFLMSQLSEEPAMTSALMIQTLNRGGPNGGTEAVKQCIETISKYLENIAANPTEEKFRRIRCLNKVLTEKVLTLRGTEEFLQAAGFTRRTLAGMDGNPEQFLIMEGSAVDAARLTELREILTSAEPIRPELDRATRVFHYSSAASNMPVPDEFFRISAEEIRREQAARTAAVEQCGMLRTRQMREQDRRRELRRYRYCLVRVRLPDGVLLQATFYASEKLSTVVAFVRDCLVAEWIPFVLSTSGGQRLAEGDNGLTLAELDLCPASLLNLAFNAEVLEDLAASHGGKFGGPYLKPELMAAIASL